MLIEENVSIAPFTTFKTGGSVRFFARVRTLEDIREAAHFAIQHRARLVPIGMGSNILFGEGLLNIFVIKNEIIGRKVDDKDLNDVLVTVGSGENWDDLVAYTVQKGWYGLENLSYIPGTVGATPVQNIGAYGVEVSELVDRVEALNVETGEVKTFSKEECVFAYRSSFFKSEEGKKYFITTVTFKLEKKGRVNIGYKDLKEFFKDRYSSSVSVSELREAVVSIRKNKLPDWNELGTAGSFFKNPVVCKEHFDTIQANYPDIPNFPDGEVVKVPLAWILDKVLGMKGYRVGAVGLYEKQPLALVNYGGATTAEILALAKEIEQKVQQKLGIEIEKEVVVIEG
jgi:UDP-N-acetylmuramate dehydrogenase